MRGAGRAKIKALTGQKVFCASWDSKLRLAAFGTNLRGIWAMILPRAGITIGDGMRQILVAFRNTVVVSIASSTEPRALFFSSITPKIQRKFRERTILGKPRIIFFKWN